MCFSLESVTRVSMKAMCLLYTTTCYKQQQWPLQALRRLLPPAGVYMIQSVQPTAEQRQLVCDRV